MKPILNRPLHSLRVTVPCIQFTDVKKLLGNSLAGDRIGNAPHSDSRSKVYRDRCAELKTQTRKTIRRVSKLFTDIKNV